jgi:nitrite reductase (NO-forming)
LNERTAREHLTNVRPALVPMDDPKLPAGGVDRVLIVDTWHHIPDREAYAAKLRSGLKVGGRALVVDFKLEVPGTFILVDHSLIRAFNKGALGMLKVEGAEDHLVYSGREVDEVYLAEYSQKAVEARKEAAEASAEGESLEARMARGKATFQGTCSTCHQAEGQGLASVFPPLAKSDFLMADKERSVHVVLAGLSGPITVNGQPYDNVMPSWAHLTDHELANVLTYVRNSFGNQGEPVTDDEVAKVRASLPKPAEGGHP